MRHYVSWCSWLNWAWTRKGKETLKVNGGNQCALWLKVTCGNVNALTCPSVAAGKQTLCRVFFWGLQSRMYLFNKNACSYFAIIILFFLFFYPHEMTHMAGECTLDPHSLTEQSGINREMYERQIQHPCSTVYQRVETLRSSKTLLFRPPLSGDVNSPPASAPEQRGHR